MKINNALLNSFIKKASLGGKITSINLNFTADGLKSAVTSVDNICLTITDLYQNNFQEYKAIGEIFLKDTGKFMKYLSTFNGDISIEKIDKHILKLFDEKREIFVIVGDEIVCENVFRKEEPKPNYDTTANINKQDLSRTITDLKDANIGKIKINKKDNFLIFEVGLKDETDFIKTIIEVEGKGNASVVLGEAFIGLYNALDEEATLSMETNKPIIAEEINDTMRFKCIIAPMIDE